DGVDRPLLGKRGTDARDQREEVGPAIVFGLLPDTAHTRSSGRTGSTTQLRVAVRDSRFRGTASSQKPTQPVHAARVECGPLYVTAPSADRGTPTADRNAPPGARPAPAHPTPPSRNARRSTR